MNTEDHGLVRLAVDGDRQSLEKLYELYFKPLYRFIYCSVRNSHMTEDIVSEAFVKAFENLKNFKFKSSFKVWLYTIAKNLMFDEFKRGKKIVSDFDMTNEEDKEDAYESDDEVIKIVEGLLGSLPEKYAEVLKLRYLLNFSVKETADALNVSEANAKVLQHRAIEKAREIISAK